MLGVIKKSPTRSLSVMKVKRVGDLFSVLLPPLGIRQKYFLLHGQPNDRPLHRHTSDFFRLRTSLFMENFLLLEIPAVPAPVLCFAVFHINSIRRDAEFIA